MKINSHSLRGSILGLGAALLLPFMAGAQGPSGSFTNTVTAASNAVWDFDGLTNASIDVTKDGTEVTADLALAFTQTGTGKVSASETNVPVTLNIGGGPNAGTVSFPAAVKVKGSINSTKGGAHFTFSVTGTGTATLAGESGPSRITLNQQFNGTINDANQTITGSDKESAAASGVGSISETKPFSNTVSGLQNGVLGDGGWTLTLNNLSTANNQVTGTATITLDSGQVFNYSVKGLFSATKGTKLLLSGSDALSKGSTIQVTLDTSNVVRNIKGRITGQMVNASF